MSIHVKALERGFYDQLREPGDEFDIRKEADLGRWMERVTPEHASKTKPAPAGNGKPGGKPDDLA